MPGIIVDAKLKAVAQEHRVALELSGGYLEFFEEASTRHRRPLSQDLLDA